MGEDYLGEDDLTGNIKAMLLMIEQFMADAIPDMGTFDPYGILLKREGDGIKLMFLEAVDDSDHVLKGVRSSQLSRRIENMIRHYRDDHNVISAALVIDAHLREPEGGEEMDAVIAWLDDRGKQRVRVVIYYDMSGHKFKITEKTIETRDKLFLPAS